MEEAEQKSLLSSKPAAALLIALLLLYAFNFYQISSITGRITADREVQEEASRPAEVEITKITGDCEGCYDVNAALSEIKNLNIKVTSERSVRFDSTEGKQIIAKYGITKIPSFVITGEVEKESIKSSWSQMGAKFGEIREGVFVLTKQTPPFYSIEKGSIVGGVEAILLTDSSCPKCFDIAYLTEQLKKGGVKFASEKTLDYSSDEGSALVEKFSVTRVPALLVSDDIEVYENVFQAFKQAGAKTKDGWYAMHALQPPYRDIATGKITGLVSVIFLTDSTCKDCYDVNLHKQVLPGLGISPATEKTVDVSSSEGKALVAKYTIEKVPIILLSPEVKEYQIFNQVWSQVGSVESDGWHVFRAAEVMGPYKDLKTGSVVTP